MYKRAAAAYQATQTTNLWWEVDRILDDLYNEENHETPSYKKLRLMYLAVREELCLRAIEDYKTKNKVHITWATCSDVEDMEPVSGGAWPVEIVHGTKTHMTLFFAVRTPFSGAHEANWLIECTI